MEQKAERLKDALLSVLVLLAAIGLAWAGLRSSKPDSVSASAGISEPSFDASSIPDDAIVVVVDAGHGGFDGGAVGSRTGVPEAELNLKVAKLLADELTAKGYYVIMTRTDNDALGPSKKADMQRRKEIMQLGVVDLVVSVHMNKFDDTSIGGPMVFYMKNSDEGKALAECILGSICSELGTAQRYANPEDLFVLREPYAPSVLVECGFLSNANDEARLMEPEYRAKLAKAIADGLEEYCVNKQLTPAY